MIYRLRRGLVTCALITVSCSPPDPSLQTSSEPVDMDLESNMDTSKDIASREDMPPRKDLGVDMPVEVPCVDTIGRELTCTPSPLTQGEWCCPPGPESCDAPPIGGVMSPDGTCDNASWDIAPVGWWSRVDEHGCTVLMPGDESCLIPPPQDMDTDMARDMRPDLPPPEWDFTLVNISTEPVFIQQGTTDEYGHWQIVRDGEVLPTGNKCETCDCASCSQCVVCGRAIHDVIRIDPGERRGFNWDRLVWQRLGQSCPQSGYFCETNMLASDGDYILRVIYSRGFVEDDSAGVSEKFIGPPIEVDTPFALPFDGPFEVLLE